MNVHTLDFLEVVKTLDGGRYHLNGGVVVYEDGKDGALQPMYYLGKWELIGVKPQFRKEIIMLSKLQRVIEAIDNCEGTLIPYPTIKKMHKVKKELLSVINENAEPAVQADVKELACPECGHIVGCLAPCCDFKSKVTA